MTLTNPHDIGSNPVDDPGLAALSADALAAVLDNVEPRPPALSARSGRSQAGPLVDEESVSRFLGERLRVPEVPMTPLAEEAVERYTAAVARLKTDRKELRSQEQGENVGRQRDIDEAARARALGEAIPPAAHGPEARAAVEVAEMEVAASLQLARKAMAHAKRALIDEYPAIRTGAEDQDDADRAEAGGLLDRLEQLMEQIRARNAALGKLDAEYGVHHATDETVIAARQRPGTTHERTHADAPSGTKVLRLLHEKRNLPRPPAREVATVRAWIARRALISAWTPGPPEPAPAEGDSNPSTPSASSRKAGKTSASNPSEPTLTGIDA